MKLPRRYSLVGLRSDSSEDEAITQSWDSSVEGLAEKH
jgi:hypothetical protein